MSSDESSIHKESQFDDITDSFSILSSSPPRRTVKSRRTTNTGPKGVRADARAYEASKREANALRTLKGVALSKTPSTCSLPESGSDMSEDEWMSRWREKRMKELSKKGVAGVNLFGQVDDVDAKGYLDAVDYEDLDEDSTHVMNSRFRARRNVTSVVLIYNNVFSFFMCVNGSLPIQNFCFKYFRNLLGVILRLISFDCRLIMRKICLRLHFPPFWLIAEEL
jgi:hypothetical protein